MLQTANTDLFNSLDPKAHNTDSLSVKILYKLSQ